MLRYGFGLGLVTSDINKDGWPDLYISNDYIFNRKFHVMMLEEQLKKHPILRSVGAFSIRKRSRDSIKSLHYCKEILSDAGNLLLLFPQGEIQSMHTEHYKFEKGLVRILESGPEQIQILFNLNLLDYAEFKKPSVKMFIEEYQAGKGYDLQQLQAAYNNFARTSKERQVAP